MLPAAVSRDRSVSRWHRQRGTSLVELALILPFMLVLMLTVVDLSRAFYMKGMLTSAAREGARVACDLQTPASSPSADNDSVKAHVSRTLLPVTANASYGLSNVSVNVTPTGSLYKVTVSGRFTWLYLGLLNAFQAGVFSNPETLTASTAMPRIGG